MIVGIGVDIVSVKRIRDAVALLGDSFINSFLTKKERAEYVKRKHCSFYLAKRFAAKEAIGKALGSGIATEYSVLNHESGKPYVQCKHQSIHHAIHISLSDEQEYVTAYVVVERLP